MPGPKGAVLTSELDFAGDVLLEPRPQLRVILKVVEMVFDPLAENIEDPERQRLVTTSFCDVDCDYNTPFSLMSRKVNTWAITRGETVLIWDVRDVD